MTKLPAPIDHHAPRAEPAPVFAKLGVSSRRQLRRALPRELPAAEHG